jgi:hypothetical protein
MDGAPSFYLFWCKMMMLLMSFMEAKFACNSLSSLEPTLHEWVRENNLTIVFNSGQKKIMKIQNLINAEIIHFIN